MGKSEITGDQLYIDKLLLQEVKRRKKNLAIGWVDYWKAYDMIYHSWVIKSLNIMGIAKYVVNFMGKTMKSWSLLIAGQTIEEAEDTETK